LHTQTVANGPPSATFAPLAQTSGYATGTTSVTTEELRHLHYNTVCDVTNITVFIMSSQWMI